MIIYNPRIEPVHGKTHQESVIFLIRKKGYKTFPVILKLGKNHKNRRAHGPAVYE